MEAEERQRIVEFGVRLFLGFGELSRWLGVDPVLRFGIFR